MQHTQTPKHTSPVAFGIDLGTTHSVVGMHNGKNCTVLSNSNDGPLIPSAFWQDEHTLYAGHAAFQKAKEAGQKPLTSIKRLMGRTYSDVSPQLQNAFPISPPHPSSENATAYPHIRLKHEKYTVVELSAALLKYVCTWTHHQTHQKLNSAVITVPAYFDDRARSATEKAAHLANIEVLRLISEPTAAALAYGIQTNQNGLYGVYDLGGGTFDFSLLRIQDGVFHVIGTGGDLTLGGDDFDDALLQHLKQHLDGAHNFDPHHVRHVRTTLSTHTQYAFHSGYILTQETLENIIDPWVQKSLEITQQVLNQAHINAHQLNAILCVGGTTRTPYIMKCLKERFSCPVFLWNPDHAVALGAAIQAHLLTSPACKQILLDVNPLSLGIETLDHKVDVLIPRNSPIPCEKTHWFTTAYAEQTHIKINVVQGESLEVQQCRALGQFEVRNIPPMPAGQPRLSVTFTLNENGILKVKAHEHHSHTHNMLDVHPIHQLDDITPWMHASQHQNHMRNAYVQRLRSQIECALSEARMCANCLPTESAHHLLNAHHTMHETLIAQNSHTWTAAFQIFLDDARPYIEKLLIYDMMPEKRS